MKPILFLDVDGVCAPLGWPDDPGYLKVHVDSGFHICVSKDLPNVLNTLSRYYDFVWATTWNDKANGIRKWFGLEEDLPVCYVGWPKDNDIVKYANGRAFAWVDDDCKPHEEDDKLFMRINHKRGLTMDDVPELIEFANRVTGDKPAISEDKALQIIDRELRWLLN
jgi:hypothetical protein